MPTAEANRGGTTNTFVVRVLETGDKGWVGVVTHVQTGRRANFKGFIEAVRFMDSFIEGGRVPKTPDKHSGETLV